MTTLGFTNTTSCPQNCSHHGMCEEGTCACRVHYTGEACDTGNLGYLLSFGSIFYVVGLISICQLVFCMRSEFKRKQSFRGSCQLTTQKLLYVLTAFAAFIRGTYFYVAEILPEPWEQNLLCAYYPFILSCMSLVVCFWAETFHLSGIPLDRPGFLTKSMVGFLTANLVFYSFLTAQFTVTEVYSSQLIYRKYLQNVFKGCFAGSMLIVLIFFLIYGIQVYFKIRGSFRESDTCQIDSRQLCMSRFGLLAEAILQLTIVVFLCLEVGKVISIEYLSVLEQNSLDVLFRVVELGASLWFPCVLWNVKKPEELWILNPKTLISLSRLHEPSERSRLLANDGQNPIVRYNACESPAAANQNLECWICYESDEPSLGRFIEPCKCRGDTSVVHHKCLQKWLMESKSSPDRLSCTICKERYNLKQGAVWLPDGLRTRQWAFITIAVTFVFGFPFFTAWMFYEFSATYIRVIMMGVTVMVEYICFKFLGIIFIGAYQRAKIAGMQILGRSSSRQEQSADQEGRSDSSRCNVDIQIQVDVHHAQT